MTAKTSRRLRNALVVALVLAALYGAYRYTLHRMVEAKLDAISKQGYPVTLAELDKWYPQPSPGENAADMYLQAFERYVKDKGDTNLPVVGYAPTPGSSTPLSQEMRQGIANYLAQNQQALDLFHRAATMKFCRFPSDESDVKQMFESLIKRLNATRTGTRMLLLESLLASASGDTHRAVESTKASIALAESVRNPPRLIPYLVEHACLGMSIGGVQQTLSRTAISEQDLVDLAKAFHKVETDDGFKQAIIGERAQANERWQEMRAGRGSAEDLIAYKDTASELDRAIAVVYRPLGLIDLDYFGQLGFYDEFLRANEVAFPQRLAKVDSLNHKHALFNVLPVASMEANMTEGMVKHEAQLQAQLRAVRAALSLERYRAANSALPDSLDALVPRFLAAVPIDPFDGQPLRYKKLAKGYVVYSVGQDGVDNGGTEGYCPGTDITFTVER